MSTSRTCSYCHRSRPLIVCLLFLLVSSITLEEFKAEGRTMTKLLEAAEKGVEEEMVGVRAQTIGSRPPSCDRRCSSCGHCEAVQVPVTTQSQRQSSRRSRFASAISTIAYSRGDDISNYKPMSWKCKCGNLIFDP